MEPVRDALESLWRTFSKPLGEIAMLPGIDGLDEDGKGASFEEPDADGDSDTVGSAIGELDAPSAEPVKKMLELLWKTLLS